MVMASGWGSPGLGIQTLAPPATFDLGLSKNSSNTLFLGRIQSVCHDWFCLMLTGKKIHIYLKHNFRYPKPGRTNPFVNVYVSRVGAQPSSSPILLTPPKYFDDKEKIIYAVTWYLNLNLPQYLLKLIGISENRATPTEVSLTWETRHQVERFTNINCSFIHLRIISFFPQDLCFGLNMWCYWGKVQRFSSHDRTEWLDGAWWCPW